MNDKFTDMRLLFILSKRTRCDFDSKISQLLFDQPTLPRDKYWSILNIHTAIFLFDFLCNYFTQQIQIKNNNSNIIIEQIT